MEEQEKTRSKVDEIMRAELSEGGSLSEGRPMEPRGEQMK